METEPRTAMETEPRMGPRTETKPRTAMETGAERATGARRMQALRVQALRRLAVAPVAARRSRGAGPPGALGV